MEAQTLFDTVAKHLLAQGKKSVTGDEKQCRYRGENGLTCAVGCLIPDEVYDDRIEGRSISRLGRHRQIALRPELEQFLDDVLAPHAQLLQELQYVHDDFKAADWKSSLIGVAVQFKLHLPDVLQDPKPAA